MRMLRISNSIRHKNYATVLRDEHTPLVIATGPAGTGKTRMPSLIGLEKLTDKRYERIVITRPTIAVGGESIGFLPGDINEKMSPWVSHMMEYIDMYDLKFVKSNVDVVSMAYIRGHTLKDRWVIADEMQNSTPMQMKTLLTRVGENTKLVITGDLSQSDLDIPLNGLQDLLNRIDYQGDGHGDGFAAHIAFMNEDVKRSDFVKHVLKLYS